MRWSDSISLLRRVWPRSTRLRLQLSLACLLLCVLTSLGAALYELHGMGRFREIDAELQGRVGVLSTLLRERGHEAPGPPRGLPPRRPPPNTEGVAHFDRLAPPPPPTRHLRLSPDAALLFGRGARSYYYTVWDCDDIVSSRSKSAPAYVAPPHHSNATLFRMFGRRRRRVKSSTVRGWESVCL
jgi:hypothetical protein